jgi:hypothetical protein
MHREWLRRRSLPLILSLALILLAALHCTAGSTQVRAASAPHAALQASDSDTPTTTDTATDTLTPVSTDTATTVTPGPSASIALQPGTQAAGPDSAVTVVGAGFQSGEEVDISYAAVRGGGSAQPVTTGAIVLSNGTFSAALSVPADVVPATYTVRAVGLDSGSRATATLTVLPQVATAVPTATDTPTDTPQDVPTDTPQDAPTDTPVAAITVDPTTEPAGDGNTVSVQGSGYGSGEDVVIWYDATAGDGSTITEATDTYAADDGSFSAALPVPGAVTASDYTVTAVGTTTALQATADLTVTASEDTPAPDVTDTTTVDDSSLPTDTPVPDAQVEIQPDQEVAGPNATVAVTGGGFAPGETVTLSYNATLDNGTPSVETAGAMTFDNGTFVATLPVPADVAPGDYTVTAIGLSSTYQASGDLTVLAPDESAQPTDTAPAPTATVAPSPTAARPPVAIDGVAILPRGKTADTQHLLLGQAARFVVMYHLATHSSQKPSASLSITKSGKPIGTYSLSRTTYDGKAAFARTITLGPSSVAPRLYAHFRITLGNAAAKRDRRFAVARPARRS